jgi:hypothetical protein
MAIDYSTWPRPEDISGYFQWAGVNLAFDDTLLVVRALDGAAREFERRTQYRPFLSDGLTETRLFDSAPNTYLDLRAGLLSVSSLTVNGQPYAQGTQFWLKPDNAPAEGKPFTAIDFSGLREFGYAQLYSPLTTLFFPGFGHQSVAVTGVWGYCLQLPPDVWQAVMVKAAASVLRPYGVKRAGGMVRWEESGVSEQYASTPRRRFARRRRCRPPIRPPSTWRWTTRG